MGAAKEASIDAAIEVLSGLQAKNNQKNSTVKAFFGRKHCLDLLSIGFGKSYVKGCDT